jgi:hypothetical protein
LATEMQQELPWLADVLGRERQGGYRLATLVPDGAG